MASVSCFNLFCSGLVFKNQGKAAGASMEHSHSQIIALPIIPHHVELEIDNARSYFQREGRCIFCDIVRHDIADGSRLIDSSTEYAVLAPYAPKFPYETWIVPQTHASNFEDIDDLQLQSLAKMLLTTVRKMERLFNDVPFNYMLHSSPVRDYCNIPFYHWTIRVVPHLLTLDSQVLKKFLKLSGGVGMAFIMFERTMSICSWLLVETKLDLSTLLIAFLQDSMEVHSLFLLSCDCSHEFFCAKARKVWKVKL
ncbi:hypothetical protein GOP47_0027618 [Adiantum capillus-veneris]|nr:hypothetical protein GOP47_0027618 [Adiantum capillus-veneris]